MRREFIHTSRLPEITKGELRHAVCFLTRSVVSWKGGGRERLAWWQAVVKRGIKKEGDN
tara:strand:- start:90 stop:266 length:177 start_codon:yes stop_codon:yes gene_type:complete